ncbi:MAG: NifB/NifX family molybdenum-iron cluster-binding protein [Pseudomonadota bacterium]
MKVCFPVQANDGLESEVYGHFGSAPMFIVVDMEANKISVINNRDMHHMHGACNPIKAFDGQNVDAIVVGGIGAGALSKLNQSGIRVYQAQAPIIKDNMVMFKSKSLQEITLQHCCGGHEGECAH